MKKLLFAVFTISFFMVSCGDDGVSPTITISSPENGACVAPGGTLTITGTATDDVDLVSLRFFGADINLDGTVPGSDFSEVTGGTFSVDVNFDMDSTPGMYTIDIIATDDEANTTTQTLDIEVK